MVDSDWHLTTSEAAMRAWMQTDPETLAEGFDLLKRLLPPGDTRTHELMAFAYYSGARAVICGLNTKVGKVNTMRQTTRAMHAVVREMDAFALEHAVSLGEA